MAQEGFPMGYELCANSERNSYRILPNEIWSEIRRQFVAGMGPAEICRRFGVARSTLSTRRKAGNWDDQRRVARQIRAECAAPAMGSGKQGGGEKDGLPDQLAALDPAVQEPLWEQDPGGAGHPVRNPDREGSWSRKIEEVRLAHVSLAAALRRRLDLLVAEGALGVTPGARPSRDVLDVATALEKLQRIERTALGVDDQKIGTRDVVIVIPAKLSTEEWQARAKTDRLKADWETVTSSPTECQSVPSRG